MRRYKNKILLLSAALIAGCALFLVPRVKAAQEMARCSNCRCQLKQLAIALHTYHDTYGAFPPAYVVGNDGRPWHSWRVLLLPYLDERELYEKYHFSEPWDGPNNLKLLHDRPLVYSCPSHAEPASTTRSIVGSIGLFACGTGPRPGVTTSYAGVFGLDCIFRGPEPVAVKDIADGTAVTLMIGEATGANIPWTKPDDIDLREFPRLRDSRGFSSPHDGGVHFLMADGSYRFFERSFPPATLHALATRSGGEVHELND